MSPIALVSCLPPAQTGVADFTHRILHSQDETLRAYATRRARLSYFARNPLDATRWRVRPLGQLERDAARDLDAVVVMVGNSHHFVPVVEWASSSRAGAGKIPLLLYLHEAFVVNVLGLCSMGNERVARLAQEGGYDARLPTSHAEITAFVARRVLGCAELVKLLRPDMVLVNGVAAKQMIESDREWLGEVPVEPLFHPVFPSRAEWQRERPALSPRVGSFGMPNPLKQLDLIVRAHVLCREKDPRATLVLAGYGMGDFAASQGLAAIPGIEVHDSPSDARLDSLMASVDIAVQLRAEDLGESSGVIARLLAIGTPLIVSPRGSALELGDAVAFTGATVTAHELVALIHWEVARPGHRRNSARRVVARQSPRLLVARLAQLARDVREQVMASRD